MKNTIFIGSVKSTTMYNKSCQLGGRDTKMAQGKLSI